MTEKMTLSEMFRIMSQLQCGSTMVHSIKVYRIPQNNLGDIKVMSAVAARKRDLYELVSLIMTVEPYPKYRKYRNYYVVAECHDGDVYKVWIAKNS